jgi:hypothetical protein
MKTTCHAVASRRRRFPPQEWRALLRAKGWKQKELARRWNVSETWISKLPITPNGARTGTMPAGVCPIFVPGGPANARAAGTDAPEPGGPE